MRKMAAETETDNVGLIESRKHVHCKGYTFTEGLTTCGSCYC